MKYKCGHEKTLVVIDERVATLKDYMNWQGSRNRVCWECHEKWLKNDKILKSLREKTPEELDLERKEKEWQRHIQQMKIRDRKESTLKVKGGEVYYGFHKDNDTWKLKR